MFSIRDLEDILIGKIDAEKSYLKTSIIKKPIYHIKDEFSKICFAFSQMKVLRKRQAFG